MTEPTIRAEVRADKTTTKSTKIACFFSCSSKSSHPILNATIFISLPFQYCSSFYMIAYLYYSEKKLKALIYISQKTLAVKRSITQNCSMGADGGHSLNLVAAMMVAGCKHMLFSSTYCDQNGLVLDEQSGQIPLNAYRASKGAVEDILRDFGVSQGVEAVVFRYFNVAGADVEAEVGEWHQPETHLIPVMIEAAAGKRDTMTIYGTDYPTPDGTCVRDYVHVMDLVDAHIKGLEWLFEGKGSRVFNLGTSTGFSVREVIAECQAMMCRTVSAHAGWVMLRYWFQGAGARQRNWAGSLSVLRCDT
jgi:UDP-glucose 4-epimerase